MQHEMRGKTGQPRRGGGDFCKRAIRRLSAVLIARACSDKRDLSLSTRGMGWFIVAAYVRSAIAVEHDAADFGGGRPVPLPLPGMRRIRLNVFGIGLEDLPVF